MGRAHKTLGLTVQPMLLARADEVILEGNFAALHESGFGPERPTSVLQRFRPLCEDTADEEWTWFKRRS
jgi:hypothetical protein